MTVAALPVALVTRRAADEISGVGKREVLAGAAGKLSK